jgi:hypothetical protein
MEARWLREPLVHFLLLGGALYAVAAATGPEPVDPARRIEIQARRVSELRRDFERARGRRPTPAEVEGLVESLVREEVFLREARARGMDRDDPIVRRRLLQRMEALAREVGGEPPSAEVLGAYLNEHAERYRLPPRVEFVQIYFDVARRGEATADQAREMLTRLASKSRPVDPAALGDPLPLELPGTPLSPSEVAAWLGRGFAAALLDQPAGAWSGPLESRYGLHLVLVTERQEAQVPSLEEVWAEVERDWRQDRQAQSEEAFYERTRRAYEVVVEEAPPTAERGEARR